MSELLVDNQVEVLISDKLNEFGEAIKKTDCLLLDGVLFAGSFYEDKEVLEDCVKVLDSRSKDAVLVDVGTIIAIPVKDIVDALVSKQAIRLYGITRIVGYYSRINNWNKSKVSELQDRHKGVYGW